VGPSLAAWLNGEAGRAPRAGGKVAVALGRAVRRLHDAGFCFRDLYAKHLFLEGLAGPDPRIVLIDAQRAWRYTPGRSIDDLAALYATTLAPGVRRTDRLRFLREYLGQPRIDAAARRLIARIERRARKMRGRGQDPNLIAARHVAVPGLHPLALEKVVSVDGGRLHVNEVFRPALEAAGLTTLDALMSARGGDVYRAVPGRSTVRLELADPGGGTRAVYLKRHCRAPAATRLRRLLTLNEPISLARHELRQICRMADIGIPTMRFVAIGEACSRVGPELSCLVTEEVPGAVQTDDYCEQTFGRAAASEKAAARRRLVREIARLARRFHAGGYVHRDFYLCHILVRPAEGGEVLLHLIDLQRVDRNLRGAPRRWIVKDLAALLFSSWPSPATGIRSKVFTNTDRMRFAREYFGVRRLGRAEKAIVRSAVRKARRIADRQERRRRRALRRG
ncbi:MAG: hypothetical protein IMZ66_06120, partial [Planctomycetes bacterium]|nr:hypothetical protein [Planctomycetota bacterium]